jgi:nucleoside-diphosphate-sugar epimerase
MGLEVLLMLSVLITGASGFIGSAICHFLSTDKIIGIDIKEGFLNYKRINWEQTDLTNVYAICKICSRHLPDVVVHCAGIAHQKIGAVDSATYLRVNSEVTENLAKAAAASNPDLHFIFLSTISVYGENYAIQPIAEDAVCSPSSDYAASKLNAEKRLIRLYEEGLFRRLTILRLAPVYDREWSLNLERRVFAPKKIAFLKFGAGKQKMSALARPNLVEFIDHLLKTPSNKTGIAIMNVCDKEPYEFNNIIHVFKDSKIFPTRTTISIPLPIVWWATRIAGFVLRNKKNWLHSCYDKLASDLVFDNSRMLQLGFNPLHTLETVFAKNK